MAWCQINGPSWCQIHSLAQAIGVLVVAGGLLALLVYGDRHGWWK